MADYIPSRRADRLIWFTNFAAYCVANGVTKGMPASLVTDLTAAVGMTTADMVATDAGAATQRALVQTEKLSDAEAERLVRLSMKYMAPVFTDVDRVAAGAQPKDTSPTAGVTPTSRPVLQIDTSKPLQHGISFADQGTPTSEAKPEGADRIEIWVKIGDPAPTSYQQCQFAGTDGDTPFLKSFDGADAGKTAHYLARWMTKKGEGGPWSETHGATVTGV